MQRRETNCDHEGITLVDEAGSEACWDCAALLFRRPIGRAGGGRQAEIHDVRVREVILEAIRAGVNPAVAAGAAGISAPTWRTWRRRTDEPYVSFFEHVRMAEMTAVSEALRHVKTTDVKAWLKHAQAIEGVWREPTKQVNVAVGGSGVPIQFAPAPVDLSKLSNEQLAQLEQLLAHAKPAELAAHNDDVIDVEAEPVE